MLRTLSIVLTAGVALGGCVTEKETLKDPPLLGGDDILAKGTPPVDFDTFKKKAKSGEYAFSNVDKARRSVLRQAASSYAAQAGYYKRAYEIMKELEAKSGKLSNAFNFNRVVYATEKEAGFVVPPVVTRGKSALNINDTGTKSTAADEYYRIEQPGRIVGVVPTWRDYLVLPLDEPNEPSLEFQPQNHEERKLFQAYLKRGWRAGTQQADDALKANMSRLRRDYLGMIEYRRLVKAGLIKQMAVRHQERPTSGDINELFIDERTVKIVDAAKFEHDPNKWRPITRRLRVKH